MRSYTKSKFQKFPYIYGTIFVTISSFIFINNVHAEDLNYSVSVEPALNITTSASKVSLDLNPLTKPFDSQDLKVSVSTNNETGYELYVNTNTTNLIEKNDNNLYIETLNSEISEEDFKTKDTTLNKWGYKLNNSNFLPFETKLFIKSSKTAIEDDSSTLTFAAKVDYGTKAGTYNLALNFQATANPLCSDFSNITYMQEIDSVSVYCDNATGSLVDERDGQIYTVAKINEGIWMTRNLAIGCNGSGSTYGSSIKQRTLTPSDSNVSSSWTTPTTSLNSGQNAATDSDVAAMFCSASYGAWYNYITASVGTIRSNSNQAEDVYNICPKNWTLPSKSQIEDFINNNSNFSPIAGGHWGWGPQIYSPGLGRWFSSMDGTGDSTYSRYALLWDSSQNSFQLTHAAVGNGHYVRCVHSN